MGVQRGEHQHGKVYFRLLCQSTHTAQRVVNHAPRRKQRNCLLDHSAGCVIAQSRGQDRQTDRQRHTENQLVPGRGRACLHSRRNSAQVLAMSSFGGLGIRAQTGQHCHAECRPRFANIRSPKTRGICSHRDSCDLLSKESLSLSLSLSRSLKARTVSELRSV